MAFLDEAGLAHFWEKIKNYISDNSPNSDWNATSGAAQILNKPTLAAVATSGNYNDLTNKPYIPQNTSNWSHSNGTNGWARDNTTGFTIQWGSQYANANDNTIRFPRSFTLIRSVAISDDDYSIYRNSGVKSKTNSDFVYWNENGSNLNWIAVGYT